MAPATEILACPLKPGSSVEPGTETAAVLDDCLTTLRAQPGLQRIYYGTELEAPNTFRLFVDWESIDEHTRFQKSPEYQPFLKKFTSLLDAIPTIGHASLSPHPPAALSPSTSPVTELVTCFFPPAHTPEDKHEAESSIRKLISVIASHAPGNGFITFAGGWVREPQSHEGAEHTAYVGAVGWTSKEAHLAFRETDAFAQNIHLLREAKGLQAVSMCHSVLTEVQPGAGSSGGLSMQEEVLNPVQGEEKRPATTKDGMTTKFTR